jgi:capsular polysaccharide biosynthesis protein
MELKHYWQVIMRYWLLIVILTLVGLVASYQYYVTNRPIYQAVAVVNIVQIPSTNDAYSGIYANQSSEFAADEFTKILVGNKFMTDVASQLKEGNIELSPDELKGMVAVESKHRILTITISHKDQNTTLQTARAVATILENRASEFVKPRQVNASIVDTPSQASLSGGRTVLLAAVRVLAGLIAGIGLAFLLAYLDTSVKTTAELEELLGLPVMGAIPGPKRFSFGRPPQNPPGDDEDDHLAKARLLALQSQKEHESASTH